MDSDSSPGLGSQASTKKGVAFWLVFISLCFSLFLSAIELTAVSTTLPVIVHELEGSEFAWVGTAYSLAATAFLPMSGGVAEIFGRRPSMLGVLITFALGSALCGSAKSMHWLIAARAVQGLGGGGILSLSSIIVSDMVPLRERGVYNGLIGLVWAIASAIGPIIGGALASHGQWRWLFYLNLPICGVSFAMVATFLKQATPPGTVQEKLSRMDWIGNLLVILSTTGIVLGLTWGGTTYSWSSAAVIVPIVLGGCGLIVTFLYEGFLATHPLIPFEILSNVTSLSGYIQTFVNSLVVLSIAYYLPVYYQACKNASALHSGVLILGLTAAMGPCLIVAGTSVKLLQVYRPQLWLGWLICIAGMSALTTVNANTPTSIVAGLPALLGAGTGVVYTVAYFPVLAPLPVTLTARALAFFSFCRSFAAVWGITIGATILQNILSKRLPSELLSQLPSSQVDLAFAIIPKIRDMPQPLQDEVREAFAEAIAAIWKAMVGFLAFGLLASFAMKALPLQNTTDEKWNLSDGEKKTQEDRGTSPSASPPFNVSA